MKLCKSIIAALLAFVLIASPAISPLFRCTARTRLWDRQFESTDVGVALIRFCS